MMEEPGSQPAADQAAEAGEAQKAVEDDDEEEEARALEQLRLEEEAARKRREEVEASLRRKREAKEAEERRRKEEQQRKAAEEDEKMKPAEEEQKRKAAEEQAASAKAEAKFDELERRLEQEERGGAKQNGDAQPKTGDDTATQAFSEGETAELQVYMGKWVPCRILSAGSKPDTWSVHILPTTMFDNAAGRSDTDVPDAPLTHLRKASAAPAAAEAPQPTADAAAPAPDAAPAPTATEEGTAATGEAAEGGGAPAAEAAPPAGSEEQGGKAGAEERPGDEAPGDAAPAAAAEASKQPDVAPAEAPCPAYEVGGRVVIEGLADKPQLNGVTGTLVDKKWKGNWIVDLDDEEGKKRRLRRRWLINESNFKASDKPEMKKYTAAIGRPKQQYFIVGSWNDFVPRRMTWDHDRCCWTFEVKVGSNGFESFQIWLERDKKKSVHPDTANAGNYVPWELRGPDADGENKNWSFGNEGSEGTRFEVRLFLWEDESPQSVEWTDVEASKKKDPDTKGGAAEAKKNKCPKGHELKIFKPPVDGYSCSQCKKTFPKGTTFLSCRPCDFDICQSCASGSKATLDSSSPTAAAKDARKFLDSCGKDSAEDSAGGGSSAPVVAAAEDEALRVGDKVVIKSSGPFKGRTGTVMRVDEDGDPAVRLETGEAKLFYRADVAKLAASGSAATPAPANGAGKGYPGRGIASMLGKGAGGGSMPFNSVGGKGSGSLAKGLGRGPGVLGFR